MLSKSANRTPELFQPGTRVIHYSDRTPGVVLTLDENLIELGYSSTTCTVLWDDCEVPDIQWTNKLLLQTNPNQHED